MPTNNAARVQDACVCIFESLFTLTTADIVATDKEHTVCTNTQCFATHTDAFGVYTPHRVDGWYWYFAAMVVVLAGASILTRPRNVKA